MKTILVTGGAGYIGTHVLTALAAQGLRCVCVDNHSNSSPRALDRVREITEAPVVAHVADIRDREALDAVFAAHSVEAVIHLAGLKAVGESVEKPLLYYDNNVNGTLRLLEAMDAAGVRKLVFSSSATVYGAAERMPVDEGAQTRPQSPYGRTKLMNEEVLADLAQADPAWRIASLRYFNPVGAHPSGRIGEDPAGIPNNLMPFICQTAAGRREKLRVFGTDYPTADGSGVRDYIHVMDLAEGHVAALRYLEGTDRPVTTVNLGTGRGISVLELVRTFERMNGVTVAHETAGRRAGDVATCYADVRLAERVLGWRARRGVEEMCRDAWRWQAGNPEGYGR